VPEYARLPVHKLKTTTAELNLGDAKVYHLPDWQNLTHPQRLTVIRQIAMMRGRDARIARVVVGLLKRSGARPRQYGKQAAAILKWVQDPENVYYVNEPGERLQDPVYTIKAGHGDCDDQVILLAAMFESVGLPWKLVLSGRGPAGEKVRFIEGQPVPPGVAWTHIYCMVGTPPYRATQWYFCEPTVEGVPLGWDVISGDHRYLPEMSFNATGGEPQIVAAPPYKEVYGDSYGNSAGLVGGTIAGTLAQEEDAGGMVDWTKIGQAVITGVLVSVGTSLLLNWINGNGLWEGEGSAVHRWRKIAQPTRESVLIAPSPTGAKV
jgi:hypothetical protein